MRTNAIMSTAIWAALAATLAASAYAQTDARADPEPASPIHAQPTAIAETQMVVTAHPLASETALRILRAGGSAIDAAIAAQLVLNVVEPQSSGLGGGGFALHWDAAAGALTSWDGRETAPAGARPDMFLELAPDAPEGAAPEPMAFGDAVRSGRSIGAPGLPALLWELHRRYGRLDWEDLFDDAIRLAEDGFEVTPRLATLLAHPRSQRLRDDPMAQALFFRSDGAPLQVGDRLINRDLAETLREVADDGPSAIYSGDLAEAIVARVAEEPRPGTLTLEDLEGYRVIERRPVCAPFRDRFSVCGMGPPSSGAVAVGQILGLLDHAPASRRAEVAARLLFLEASRLAYADRAAYLADPAYAPAPIAGLLDPNYLMVRAQLMPFGRASEQPAEAGRPPWREGALRFAPDPSLGSPGTTHITIVDAEGSIVSLTSSIETAFGSGRMVGGFLLNNQLTDFSFRPEIDGLPVANAAAPGKRPRSSMAPTIVFDMSVDPRRPVLALGSPGGSRIPEYVAQTIVAILDWRLSPGDAVALPHVSHRNLTSITVELRPEADLLAQALEAAGYSVVRRDMTSGLGVIAIAVDGGLLGGADPRREGLAVGD